MHTCERCPTNHRRFSYGTNLFSDLHMTAIHAAAEGKPECLQFILAAGADVNVTSKQGMTSGSPTGLIQLCKYNSI